MRPTEWSPGDDRMDLSRTVVFPGSVVHLKKKGTLFWEDHFSVWQPPKKKQGKKGATEQLSKEVFPLQQKR